MTTASQRPDISQFKIRRIPSKECMKQFVCGAHDIDNWAASKAFKCNERNQSRVFCGFLGNPAVAIGFYSLSFSPIQSSLLLDQDADLYKDGYAPFIYIERLGIRKSHQNNHLGTLLLMDAIVRSFRVSEHVPIYGVALRSLNDRTFTKYKSHGFVEREKCSHPIMILPIWTIEDLVKPPTPAGSTAK